MDEGMELQVCQMWFNIVVAAAPGEREITVGTADRKRDIWPHGAGVLRIVLSRAVWIHVREECIYWWTPTSICLQSACVGVRVREINVLFVSACSWMWNLLALTGCFNECLISVWFYGWNVSDSRSLFTPGINICLIWSQVDCNKHKCKWGTKWKHIGSLKPFLEVVGITCGHIYLQCKC